MKIRLGNGLLVLDLLALIFIAGLSLEPPRWFLMLFGLPCALFVPGYALITIMFPRSKPDLDPIGRVGLSVILGFTIAGLLGLGLSLTSWGIGLKASISALCGYLALATVIAELRRRRVPQEDRFSIDIGFSRATPWGNGTGRLIAAVLILALISTFFILIHPMAFPKVEAELKVLGLENLPANYPRNFIMYNGNIVSVEYGDGRISEDSMGLLNISIINRDPKPRVFEVNLLLDGKPLKFFSNDQYWEHLGPLTLKYQESWMQNIFFTPDHTGVDQRLDVVLMVDGKPYYKDPPHIFINVS
jgi:uncharacterized membrane protein